MLVKVIDENRVKILMEDRDIELYDLPFEKLNDNDPVSRAFIYDLIQMTYEQTGVNFQGAHLMIEVVPGVSRTYYILMTRMQIDGEDGVEFGKADLSEAEMYIFRVEFGTDVIKFFEYLKRCPPEKSELYRYENAYYITLSFYPHITQEWDLKEHLNILEEYGTRCRFRLINESLLKEWGIRLAGPNAYEIFCKK